MGIYIPNMEMPTEQRMEVLIFKNGFVAYYDVYGHYVGQAKAIPLPEKHGRLIDADAPVRVVWSDGTIHSTTVSRLLCMHSLLDFPKTIVPAEGGGESG